MTTFRPDTTVHLAVVAIAAAVAVAHCTPGAPDAPAPVEPPATSAAAEGSDEAADEEPSPAAFRPAEREAPRSRATTPTADAQVGTLPEGVGLPVGSTAPDAAVRDAEGNAAAMAEFYASGRVLVVFYRGGWCPYCNFQIRDIATAIEAFQARGVLPVAISVDRVEEAYRTDTAWEIPFPILSDPDLVAHRAFGVVHQADDAEVERLSGYGIDIESASGREHHAFAVPSLFLIDEGRVIRWAHADLEYKVRPTVEQVLSAIDDVLGRDGSGDVR